MVPTRAHKIYYEPPWAVRVPVEEKQTVTEGYRSALAMVEAGLCEEALQRFTKS